MSLLHKRTAAFREATKDGGHGILTSVADDRSYRPLTLSNDLKVLLIHDSETEMVGAALEVYVGSFCDPVDVPGLAHFLEVCCMMLLMLCVEALDLLPVYVRYSKNSTHMLSICSLDYDQHMLFLGTVKYPDEAGYNKFVESHGGYSNAWTAGT